MGKLKEFKSRLQDRHMFSVVVVTLAVILSFGIYEYKKAQDYRNGVENGYRRSFHELVQYVNNVEVSLAKGMLINDSTQMANLSSEIYRDSAFASANLGQLPLQGAPVENTARFLSQVGDYTYSISMNHMDGSPVTAEETEKLKSLSKYAASLSESLNSMSEQLYSGSMTFGKVNKVSAKGSNISNGFSDTEQKTFQDYPTLIYDGPFSDHMATRKSIMLEKQPQITAEQAMEKAKAALGDRAVNLKNTGDGDGNIPTYNFSAGDKKNQISISITKAGGRTLNILSNRNYGDAKLNADQAAKYAEKFLFDQGFYSMVRSYHEIRNGTITINYAFSQNGITIYPDLVKVKVALDNGEIVGLESNGYLMNHQDYRNLPAPAITPEQAKARVNKALKIEQVNKVVIPTDFGTEVFCYEVYGSLDDKKFIVCVNAQTGKDEKILLLMISDEGTLTM